MPLAVRVPLIAATVVGLALGGWWLSIMTNEKERERTSDSKKQAIGISAAALLGYVTVGTIISLVLFRLRGH